MGTSARPRAKRGSVRSFVVARRLGYAAIVITALCACDVGRSGPEPIPECTRYAAHAEACLGARVATKLRASFAQPPTDEPGREALRAQCEDQAAQLRRSCR